MFIDYRSADPAAGQDAPYTVRLSLPGHAGPVSVDLGDGTTVSVPDGIVVHTYPGPGVYQVSAADALGRAAAATITIASTVDHTGSTVDGRWSPAGGPGDDAAEPASPGSAARRPRRRRGL